MKPSWVPPLDRAIEALRVAQTPEQYRFGAACVWHIVRGPLEAAWASPVRNTSQPVVSFAQVLAEAPHDELMRRRLLQSLDALANLIAGPTPPE